MIYTTVMPQKTVFSFLKNELDPDELRVKDFRTEVMEKGIQARPKRVAEHGKEKKFLGGIGNDKENNVNGENEINVELLEKGPITSAKEKK